MQRFKIVFLFQTTECSEWSEPYWLEVAVFFLSKKYDKNDPLKGTRTSVQWLWEETHDQWTTDKSYKQILNVKLCNAHF